MTATATRTELTVEQIEAIWHAADGTGLLCPDTEAVVVNKRDRFGYLAYNRYTTVGSARKAAKRCAAKPAFRETYVVTRGRGDSLEIETVSS